MADEKVTELPKDKPPDTHKGKRKRGRPKGSRSMASYVKIEEELNATMGAVGIMVSVRDPYCGGVVLDRGPALSEALTALARQNPRVRKALSSAIATTSWTGVIAVSLSIAVPILAHHKIVPSQLAAVFRPDDPLDSEDESANVESGGNGAVERAPFGAEPDVAAG